MSQEFRQRADQVSNLMLLVRAYDSCKRNLTAVHVHMVSVQEGMHENYK